jgi:hypothetical protein
MQDLCIATWLLILGSVDVRPSVLIPDCASQEEQQGYW